MKIWCYRLYVGTDKVDDEFLGHLFWQTIRKYTKVATFYEALGLWEGQMENVNVIELMTADVEDRDMMTSLASELCSVLGEDSVLFTGHELSDYEIVKSAEKTTPQCCADSTGVP